MSGTTRIVTSKAWWHNSLGALCWGQRRLDRVVGVVEAFEQMAELTNFVPAGSPYLGEDDRHGVGARNGVEH